MRRVLVLAVLVLLATGRPVGQEPIVLRISVTVTDADRRSIPVARHALLISAEPASAVPRRVVTSPAGTAEARLLPGRYTVESDRPVALNGRSYAWTETIEVSLNRTTTLELTADNARIGDATLDPETPTPAVESDRSSLFTRWQNSVVALWTPRTHATGFLVDSRGLVVTSYRALGDATAVEVQVSTTVKVAAKVLEADAARDVAVLWIDPAVVADVRPVPLACLPSDASSVADTDDLIAFEAPLGGTDRVISGSILFSDGAGGPVFTSEGIAVGLTSPRLPGRGGNATVVPAADVCDVVASSLSGMSAAPPPGLHLPVEPARPVALTSLTAAAAGAFSVSPYRIASSDFDIVFITPVLVARAASKRGWSGSPDYETGLHGVTEFGDWDDYVNQHRSVLLVRVTPRLVEGFWTRVARGAAETQGVSIPPIRRFRPGFSGLRVRCGATEITPIHPFVIEQHLSEAESIDEGLFVFDPAAIGPHCGEVSLMLSSAKAADRWETRVVDPAVIRRVWQDFESLSIVTP